MADVKVYSFNPTTAVTTYVSAATCTAATKSCVSGLITNQGDYFFAYTPGLCSSKNEVQCKLAYCSWSGTVCSWIRMDKKIKNIILFLNLKNA